MKLKFFILVFSLLSPLCASAQFVVNGTEAPSVQWYTFSTPNFKLIYPQECEDLAFDYAIELETAAKSLQYSIGYGPNSKYSKPLPVILHPYMSYSNGSVVWSPRRMELYTCIPHTNPYALAWIRNLAIHEGRHACQEQFVKDSRFFGALGYLCGEMIAGPADMLWGDIAMMEGDAVASETALTEAGRGRDARFLEYFKVSFDEGAFRNFDQWRYGSLKRFTPDYYKIGYIVEGGVRTFFNDPLFPANTYSHFIGKGNKGKLNNFRRTVYEDTGLRFPAAYETIADTLATLWAQDIEDRGPFQPTERYSAPAEDYFVEYRNLVFCDSTLFAQKSSLVSSEELVCFDENKQERHVCSISSESSAPDYSPVTNRLFWSDFVPSPRFERHSYSAIKYTAPEATSHLQTRSLSKKVRYFNPKTHSDDPLVAVASESPDGKSSVVVLNQNTGKVVKEYKGRAGLSVIEPAWFGDALYCIAQSLDGMGIYRVKDFKCVLKPSPVVIERLGAYEDKLTFVSDRNGAAELYSLRPLDGEVRQMTNLRHGGNDFVFHNDSLYFTVLKTDGRFIYRTAVEDLPDSKVDFGEKASHPMADALSDQEKVNLDGNEYILPKGIEPQPYNKLKNAFNLHSWIPLWVDYDELSSLSFESITTSAAPGATGFFQNELGSLYGYAGVSYRPIDKRGWQPGVHLNVTYTGIYPKFEARFNGYLFGIDGYARTYVPLNFSSDGWNRGVVPQATVNFTNKAASLTAGVTAYSVRTIPSSRYYPKYGIGGFAGYASGKEAFSAYGYVPGFGNTDGFKISAGWIGYARQASGSLAYALPFGSVDWGWKDIIYVRNFELHPKYSFLHAEGKKKIYNIHSFGIGANAVLGHFWIARTDIRVGAQYTYSIGDPWGHHELNAILSVDL